VIEEKILLELTQWLNAGSRRSLREKVASGAVTIRYVLTPGSAHLNCHNLAFAGFAGTHDKYRADSLFLAAPTSAGASFDAFKNDPLLKGPAALQDVRLYWIGGKEGAPDHSARQERIGGLFWHRLMTIDFAVFGFPESVSARDLGYDHEVKIKVNTVVRHLDAQNHTVNRSLLFK
jgi:hypothetical protein